jgi:hypothetical protein
MTKLPQTLIEAEAIAYAREHVRAIRDEKISFIADLKLSWFEKPDNRRATVQMLKTWAAQPVFLMDLCKLASAGWTVAHEAVCDLILDYRHKRIELPPALEAYDMDVVRAAADPRQRRRRRGAPEKADTYMRDIAIVFVVGMTSWKFGLKPPDRSRRCGHGRADVGSRHRHGGGACGHLGIYDRSRLDKTRRDRLSGHHDPPLPVLIYVIIVLDSTIITTFGGRQYIWTAPSEEPVLR